MTDISQLHEKLATFDNSAGPHSKTAEPAEPILSGALICAFPHITYYSAISHQYQQQTITGKSPPLTAKNKTAVRRFFHAILYAPLKRLISDETTSGATFMQGLA